MGYDEILTLEKSRKEIKKRLSKTTKSQFRSDEVEEYDSEELRFIKLLTSIYTNDSLKSVLTSSEFFELILRSAHPHLFEEWSIYQYDVNENDSTSKLVQFFLILTLTSAEKLVGNQRIGSEKVVEFFNMMNLQHWDELGEFYKITSMLERPISLLSRIYLDLIISDIIHGYSTRTIDGLMFEDLLIKYRTMKSKEFIRFCNSVSRTSKFIEKLTIKENVHEQYMTLAGVKNRQYVNK